MKNQISKRADELKENMILLAQSIHNYPELSGQEYYASKCHMELLAQNNFNIEYPFAGIDTAFKAVFAGKSSGPTIAYLAEYDALPNIGHGCGHDLLGAVSTVAAIALTSVIHKTGGRVVVLGCPAEESSGAKVEFVKKGAFRNVDAAMLAHPYDCFCESGSSLALEPLRFEFFGKEAHAVEYPSQGRNALEGLVLFFHECINLQRQLPPDIKLNGIISQGGAVANLIPDYACGDFHLRASTSAKLDELHEKVAAYAKHSADSTGTTVKISHFETPYKEMVTNQILSDCFTKNLHALNCFEIAPAMTQPFSLDMGDVSHICPAIHPYFNVCGTSHADLHTREFARQVNSDYAYTQGLITAKALAFTGADLLMSSSLLQKVKAAHIPAEHDTFRKALTQNLTQQEISLWNQRSGW